MQITNCISSTYHSGVFSGLVYDVLTSENIWFSSKLFNCWRVWNEVKDQTKTSCFMRFFCIENYRKSVFTRNPILYTCISMQCYCRPACVLCHSHKACPAERIFNWSGNWLSHSLGLRVCRKPNWTVAVHLLKTIQLVFRSSCGQVRFEC